MKTLRDRRKEMGLTLQGLADLVSISITALWRIETSGKTDLETALKLRDATGATVDEIANPAPTRQKRALEQHAA